jgi:hypothetical protein
LVISSLVLPFNLAHSLEGAIGSDRAVFRLSGVVLFTSDVLESVKALKVFKCLGSKSSQRSFTEIYSSGDFRSLRKLDSTALSQLSDDKLLSLIKVEKLKIAALGRSKDSLSKKELNSLSKRCSQLNWNRLSDEEKSLLISEVFLRDRFSQEKDVFNRLVEYARSLSIQEIHEVYANQVSSHLSKKYMSIRSKIVKKAPTELDLSSPALKNTVLKK